MKIYNGHLMAGSNDRDQTGDKKIIQLLSTENMLERACGLLKLPRLNKGQGLLINQCSSIHTFGMRYALDIVYLDRHYKVIKLIEAIKPRRMSICLRARHTLELLSGEIKRLAITPNMTLMFDDTGN